MQLTFFFPSRRNSTKEKKRTPFCTLNNGSDHSDRCRPLASLHRFPFFAASLLLFSLHQTHHDPFLLLFVFFLLVFFSVLFLHNNSSIWFFFFLMIVQENKINIRISKATKGKHNKKKASNSHVIGNIVLLFLSSLFVTEKLGRTRTGKNINLGLNEDSTEKITTCARHADQRVRSFVKDLKRTLQHL